MILATVQFNTGRGYTEHGQRITALVFQENGDRPFIVFRDQDRGIDGAIPLGKYKSLMMDKFSLQDLTMKNYDLGNYESLSREMSEALADAMEAL